MNLIVQKYCESCGLFTYSYTWSDQEDQLRMTVILSVVRLEFNSIIMLFGQPIDIQIFGRKKCLRRCDVGFRCPWPLSWDPFLLRSETLLFWRLLLLVTTFDAH